MRPDLLDRSTWAGADPTATQSTLSRPLLVAHLQAAHGPAQTWHPGKVGSSISSRVSVGSPSSDRVPSRSRSRSCRRRPRTARGPGGTRGVRSTRTCCDCARDLHDDLDDAGKPVGPPAHAHELRAIASVRAWPRDVDSPHGHARSHPDHSRHPQVQRCTTGPTKSPSPSSMPPGGRRIQEPPALNTSWCGIANARPGYRIGRPVCRHLAAQRPVAMLVPAARRHWGAPVSLSTRPRSPEHGASLPGHGIGSAPADGLRRVTCPDPRYPEDRLLRIRLELGRPQSASDLTRPPKAGGRRELDEMIAGALVGRVTPRPPRS